MSETKHVTAYLEKAVKDSYMFIGSTEDADRDGDVVRQAGWDMTDFLKNPVVFSNHDHRGHVTKFPIGVASPKLDLDHKRLLFNIKFSEANPDAQMVKALVDEGILRAVSVGFLPKQFNMIVDPETQQVKGREFLTQSLLEISVVALPANANAVRLALSKGLVTEAQIVTLGYPVHKDGTEDPILPGSGNEGLIEQLTELRAALATLTARVTQIETKAADGDSGTALVVSGVTDPPTDASREETAYCDALLDLGRKTAALFEIPALSSEAQAQAASLAATLAAFRPKTK
jgi:HK97 family phage prohead protease